MKLAILGWFGLPGGAEWIFILVVALLIFGRRLPDVARSMGKSIVEFKKGLKDVKNNIDMQSRIEPPTNARSESPSQTPTPLPPAQPDATPPAQSEEKARETSKPSSSD